MKRFELTIECDGAAFGDDDREALRAELVRILANAARRIDACSWGGVLRDVNGNVVGEFRLSDD